MFAPSESEPNLSTALQFLKTNFHLVLLLKEMLFFISLHHMTAHLQVVCDSSTSEKIIRIIQYFSSVCKNSACRSSLPEKGLLNFLVQQENLKETKFRAVGKKSTCHTIYLLGFEEPHVNQ